ncbi:MAG: FHIPEP family type III secretion protein [Gaiellaceae bacterium]
MTAPRLIPPSDLLARVEGVESTLRVGKRLGTFGWIAFIASVLEVSVLVYASGWWQGINDLEWSGLDENWPIVLSTFLLIFSVLLINWTRFWVRESRAPFRYTYSIDPYLPLGETKEEPRLLWLREDLSERLSRRIGRLSLLDKEQAATRESHIHVFGSYGIRRASDGSYAVEVFSWIQLGPHGAPATLAHPVKFQLPKGEEQLRGEEGAQAYEKLLERIYFSIATHLYRQIRQDVLRKIELLPKRYFRAAAYFYEAEDYVGSNTLDAYAEAEQLYAEVVKLYDPTWVERGHSAFHRTMRFIGRMHGSWSLFWRRWAAKAWPRLGNVELMIARAEIGYANTLLYRRALAGLSGQRLNPIFEARPVAKKAVRRLEKLGEDVPGRDSALFEALVTLANAYASLGSIEDAEPYLEDARQRDPSRAEQDARYLYVKGRVVTRQRAQFFLRAVELEPTFEVAQFELALAVERMWRRRRTLEPNVADMVADEYERVLTLNPGNIAAWASLGYMQWLLAEQGDAQERDARLERAEQFLERGREYKEIKRETFVAELDYGLARIAAERGDFKRAYRRYIEAVSAHFAQGVSHAPDGYTASHFEGITPFILRRFDAYRRRVHRVWARDRDLSSDQSASRVLDSVYAFVLNDYGEACLNYFLRSGDQQFLDDARETLSEAEKELKARYPMIPYNLNRLQRWEAGPLARRVEDAVESAEARVESILLDMGSIQRVIRYEPYWPDGRLEMALSDLIRAHQARWAADELSRRADSHDDDATASEAEAGQKEGEAQDVLLLSQSPWPIVLQEVMQGINQPLAAAAVPNTAVTSLADALQQRPPESPEGAWPVPQPEGEALLREIRELRDRAEWHRGESARLRELARRLRAEAGKAAQRAERVPKMLLPHDWLWKDGHVDWKALRRKDLIRQRRWERALDDLHVKALFALYRSLLTPTKSEGEVEPFDGSSERREDGWRLLQHLRVRFLPSDFDLLLACRDHPVLTADQAAGFERRLGIRLRKMLRRDWEYPGPTVEMRGEFDRLLRAHLENKAHQDPAYSTLYWVAYFTYSERLFDPRTSAAIFRSASNDRDLPAPLYGLLGLWLYNLTGEGTELDEAESELCEKAASKAFERAAASEEPILLFNVAQELEKREHWEGALEAYARARDIDAESDDPFQSPDAYRLAMGGALWKLGSYAEAVHELEDVKGPVAGADAQWRSQLVSELLDEQAVTTPSQYRLLKNWLGRQLTVAQVERDEETRADAASALLRLTYARYQSLIRRPLDPLAEEVALALTPLVAPIVLEAHEGLLPDAEPEARVAEGNGQRPAETRRDLLRQIGVELPQIRVLATAKVRKSSYRLRLDEVPIEEGRFRDDELLFVRDGAEARERGLEGHEGANPLGGPPGLWVSEESAASEEELEVWDRYTFMLKQAKALLLRNLTSKQLEDLVEQWVGEDSDARSRLLAQAVPDEAARIRFAAVLRALLGEGVSVVELAENLASVLQVVGAAAADTETGELTERVRLKLRAILPGTGGWRRVIILRPELEDEIADAIHTEDGKRFLALPRAELDRLRSFVREEVPSDVVGWSSVVAVLTPGLRPFVRALVALDHPTLPVVAFTELPEGRRLAGEQRLGRTMTRTSL